MVGTPQLPFKYRRKGNSDYRVYSPDLDMADRALSSSLYCPFGSDDSVPHSPLFYHSSSSSVASSSPMRSLYTPEPPSSPLIEPRIASSPKSFWEVAFNYGPDFPYKVRSSVKSSPTDSVFGREKFFSRRRSSSASAPALVSDIEPSEYSEDVDPFGMDDDSAGDYGSVGGVAVLGIEEGAVSGGVGVPNTLHNGEGHEKGMKPWSGDIDVAAVLLDLSRHARVASVESTAVKVAINSIDLSASDRTLTTEKTDPNVTAPSAVVLVRPVGVDDDAFGAGADEEVAGSLEDDDQAAVLSNLDECERDSYHDGSEMVGLSSELVANSSKSEGGQASPLSSDQLESECTHVNSEAVQDIVFADVEPATLEPGTCGQTQTVAVFESAHKDVEEGDMQPEVDPIVASVFLNMLTPLSSPVLSASELSDFAEPILKPICPLISTFDLSEESFRQNPSTVSLDRSRCSGKGRGGTSRHASPVPGPSKYRSCIADQRSPSSKRKARAMLDGRRLSKSKGSLSEEADTKRERKRPRQRSVDETRSLSPTLSASSSATSRSRKKRNREMIESPEASHHEVGNEPAKASESSRLSVSLSAPPNPDSASADADASAKAEIRGCLIQAMALSRASSMPASSLLRDVLRENPHLSSQRSRDCWLDLVQDVLSGHNVFGRIERKGLDADDNPLEAQWFYMPENDPDQERAALLREMMPKKRNETKKHKQYFYKPLGKITRWDAEEDA